MTVPSFRLALDAGQAGSAPQFRDIADIQSDKLKQIHAYWSGLRAGERLPKRSDLDIDQIGYVLPNLNLVDVHRDPLDFRMRLHSVRGSDYVGADITGKSIRDYPDEGYAAFVWAVYEAAVNTRDAKVVSERLFMTDHRIMRWEGVVMPLDDKSGHVGMLLIAFQLFDRA
ncbi:PAS domain-containing protein [Thalassobaculum sp.]|uniref:PAS domain-containing protein n=1 Tax=Thalassobaculum sp. TaxID=2022740 RepID=UPI0032EE1B58